jgi:undecaprenyl-diphosphatase
MHSSIVFCAQYLIFGLALAAAVYWLTIPKRHKLDMVIFGAITVAIAYLLAKIGSALFYDTRPFVSGHVTAFIGHSKDNGFPSDHMLFGAVVAVTVWSASKKLGTVLGVLALVVGIARVLAHVHHAIDILGSCIFAAVGGLVAWYVTPHITRHLLKNR